jgi:hypothetical protein
MFTRIDFSVRLRSCPGCKRQPRIDHNFFCEATWNSHSIRARRRQLIKPSVLGAGAFFFIWLICHDDFCLGLETVMFYCCPENQEMWVHSEHTKHVAFLFIQSSLKNVAMAVFNSAPLLQKSSLLQTGHLKTCPFTSTVRGSGLVNSFINLDFNYWHNESHFRN